MKRRLLVILPLLALLALAALLATRLEDPRVAGSIDSPLLGKKLPRIPELGAMPDGPFVLNFFASWCAPCIVEHPHLMKLKAQGIPVIGVVFNDKPEKIDVFLEKHGNPFARVIYDDMNSIGVGMGITGIPESYALDKRHILRARHQGPLDDAVMRSFFSVLK